MSTDAVVQTAPSGSTTGLDRRKLHFALTTLVIAIAVILPFVVSPYTTLQLTYVVTYAITLLGLNMLIGFNGQLSLGHGAFFGIGAYTAAIMIIHAGMPYWLTPSFAAAICLLGGFLFGLPALRLEGHYLALATSATRWRYHRYRASSLEDRNWPLDGRPSPPIRLPGGAADLRPVHRLLGLAWAPPTFCRMEYAARPHRTRDGGVRDTPSRHRQWGLTPPRQIHDVGVSAMDAGLAGAPSALTSAYVAPYSFDFFLRLALWSALSSAGIATVSGAIGAISIQFSIPNIREISKSAPWRYWW